MDDTKVWVYQADRELSPDEVKTVEEKAAAFLDSWTAHGKALTASIAVYYRRFIVIFVDERQAMASGCSIDKAFHFIQEVEKQLDVNLLDRMQVAYRQGEKVLTCSLPEFEQQLEKGLLTENTIVFNNLVQTKTDFEINWEVPVKKSWHSRMLV